jgi:pteridine reductase
VKPADADILCFMAETRRVAIVTGGAKRVGRGIVETLAGAGFDIVFTYLSSDDEARNLQSSLERGGGQAVAVRADFTQPAAAVAAVLSATSQAFGRVDVLVNNASIYEPGRLSAATADQVNRLTAVHVVTPLLLCQSFASALRASRGHVVNMIDLLAERPWPEYLAYCATKAALSNLTLGLARELAPEVTVNGIAPGVAEWPPDYPQADRDKYLQRVPLARAGTPADIAAVVKFLVTEGKYLTGQILRVDGGRSIT